MRYIPLSQRKPVKTSTAVKAIGAVSGLVGCLVVVAQLALLFAVTGGLIYFVAFALTHWLRW